MNRLILTVGLPRSGKTTHARTLGFPVVQPDAVRLAVHGQRFLAAAEPLVWGLVDVMVRSLFLAGHDAVVLDATNVSRKRRDQWRGRAWSREFHVLTTPADVCLDRAGEDAEMRRVIGCMARDWEPVGEDEGTGVPVNGEAWGG